MKRLDTLVSLLMGVAVLALWEGLTRHWGLSALVLPTVYSIEQDWQTDQRSYADTLFAFWNLQRLVQRLDVLASARTPATAGASGGRILLARRPQHVHQGGLWEFPGGKVDDTDRDVVDTALRESQEEVGLAPDQVQVLGTITDYVTGTAFIVTPVVGLVNPGHSLTPNPDEVASVFEVPLAFLMNPAFHRRHALEAEGRRREWFSMPYQDGAEQRFIWGATAGMIRNFYRFLMA